MESNRCSCSGGIFIGIVSLIENCVKGLLSVYVLAIGIPYVVFAKGIRNNY